MHTLSVPAEEALVVDSSLVDSIAWDMCASAAAAGEVGSAESPQGRSHRLVVAQQTSFEKEEFSANGSHQVLHYVMKNKVYTVDVALERIAPGGEDLFFSDRGVDLRASLFYDSSDRKEVASHMTRPLSYKGKQLPSKGSGCGGGAVGRAGQRMQASDREQKGTSASFVNLSLAGMRSGASDAVASFEPAGVIRVEFSISVLSSHHQGSNFVIKFEAIDCQTGQQLPHVQPAFSQSISVISKPDVLQKKRMKEAGQLGPDKHTGAQRKRAPPKTQAMLTSLQETTAAILQHVQQLSQNSQASSAPSCGKKRLFSQRDEENPEDALGTHLRAALKALASIPGSDRPQKVRRVVNSLRAEETDRLAELTDAVGAVIRAPRCSGATPLNASGSRLPFELPDELSKLDSIFGGF